MAHAPGLLEVWQASFLVLDDNPLLGKANPLQFVLHTLAQAMRPPTSERRTEGSAVGANQRAQERGHVVPAYHHDIRNICRPVRRQEECRIRQVVMRRDSDCFRRQITSQAGYVATQVNK